MRGKEFYKLTALGPFDYTFWFLLRHALLAITDGHNEAERRGINEEETRPLQAFGHDLDLLVEGPCSIGTAPRPLIFLPPTLRIFLCVIDSFSVEPCEPHRPN